MFHWFHQALAFAGLGSWSVHNLILLGEPSSSLQLLRCTEQWAHLRFSVAFHPLGQSPERKQAALTLSSWALVARDTYFMERLNHSLDQPFPVPGHHVTWVQAQPVRGCQTSWACVRQEAIPRPKARREGVRVGSVYAVRS